MSQEKRAEKGFFSETGFRQITFSETPVDSAIPLGPGRSSGRLARLAEVIHRRKEVRIVPRGLSEKAENLCKAGRDLGGGVQERRCPLASPHKDHGSRRGRVRSCSRGAGRSGACGE